MLEAVLESSAATRREEANVMPVPRVTCQSLEIGGELEY